MGDGLPILRWDFIPTNGTPPSPTHYSIHLYPFKTLPLLKSHIHPKFTIFDAGSKLSVLKIDLIKKLINAFPSLATIMDLYAAWTRFLPKDLYEEDPSYNISDDNSNSDNYNDNNDNNDEDYDNRTSLGWACSKKRKAPAVKGKSVKHNHINSGPTWKVLSEVILLSHNQQFLSQVALSSHNQNFGEAVWTDCIHKWKPWIYPCSSQPSSS